MGNNHRLDYGEEGSQDTVQTLTEEGIVYAYDSNTGIYETPEGIRIGFVSVNEVYWGAGVEKTLEQGTASFGKQGQTWYLRAVTGALKETITRRITRQPLAESVSTGAQTW